MNAIDRAVTIMTSREFNQDTARAKRAALRGPVFITDRGRPSHVLISREEFDRLKNEGSGTEASPAAAKKTLVDVLADVRPEADFDFEFPEFKEPFKGVDFG